MNAVGIDVSKGKSMVAVMRPLGELVVNRLKFTTRPMSLKICQIFCVVWTAKFGLSWSSQAVIISP